ncbi:MAG: hypothetical protein H6741_10060 [Alphaproteobacteria bacterium]|nr:hypothetical protein [Alphaproteobacteria bacterium]MCB9793057.1 hypothetical protein [Alphaproteobacteria bacterium]
MLLALLLTLSAWAGVVVEPLQDSSGGFFDAELLTLPDGRVAVVYHPNGPVGAAWTLVPKEASWTAIPSPAGAIVATPTGLQSLVLWPDPLIGGRRWALEGESWVALPPMPPAPPSAYGVQAARVDVDGWVEAWLPGGGGLLHVQEEDGAWRVNDLGDAEAWDDDGQVFVEAGHAVAGRRRWRAPGVSEQTWLSFDESPEGQPVFVALDEGRLRTWFAGESLTLPLERSVMPALEGCVSERCTQVVVHYATPRDGRFAFDANGPVVPLLQTTRTSELLCRALPPHPCDPVGPINTCPTEPEYQCEGPTETETALLLLRRRAGEWQLDPLELPAPPLRVLDSGLIDEELQLLVETGVEGAARSLSLVRVDARGPARPVRFPEAAAAPMTLDALTTAGFVPGQGANTYQPWPEWSEAGLRTGGEAHGPGWVELGLPRREGPVRLTAEAELGPWSQSCGQPELFLRLGGEVLRLYLGGEALILEDAMRAERVPIEAPAQGAHAWSLLRDEEAWAVEVDGAEVYRRPAPPLTPGDGLFALGQRSSCGIPPGPEVLWTAISVGPVLAD